MSKSLWNRKQVAVCVNVCWFILGCSLPSERTTDPALSTETSEKNGPIAWNTSQLLSETTAAIEALLDEQTSAWNRGDIPGFMGGYWQSPELRFASGGNVTRGWQVTLDRYLARYPDRAAMGQLRFEDRDIAIVGPDSALVFGRWVLDRDNDQPQGLFTLLLRRLEDAPDSVEYGSALGWRVVADHTSSASS